MQGLGKEVLELQEKCCILREASNILQKPQETQWDSQLYYENENSRSASQKSQEQ